MVGVLAERTFVVDSNTLGANNLCRAVLGFANYLETETSSASSVDSAYPFELAYDFKTNTEYSPLSTSGSTVITVTNSELKAVNYLGIFSKNAADCNLSVLVEILNQETGLYETVGALENFENARPKMLYWKEKITFVQRITISYTSKCFIASMALGKAIVFSRPVSVGYQPGRNASLDEVSNFTTEGNNFVQGRRISNGYQEKAPINYQQYSFVDMWWRDFMNHVLDSKPFFFMANNQNQNNCVYGLQNPNNLTKPNYKNSHHTDIEFDINGWA